MTAILMPMTPQLDNAITRFLNGLSDLLDMVKPLIKKEVAKASLLR